MGKRRNGGSSGKGGGDDGGEGKKRRKEGDGLTPKQRQMLAAPPEAVDVVRNTWTKGKKSIKASSALPVLGTKGKWHAKAKEGESSSDDEEEDDGAVQKRRAPIVPPSKKTFDSLRMEIAGMAMLLTEAPEQNMKKLRELCMLCDPSKHKDRTDGMEGKVVQMAVLATVTVMKDLIPGYAIRPLTEEEKAGPVSKEVLAIRAYEQSLLSHYKAFLQRLVTLVQEADDKGMKFAAYTALNELLVTAGHFNCYEEVVVRWAVHGAMGKDERVGEACCAAIQTAFKEDQYGRVTSEIIRAMAEVIKDRDYLVPHRALSSLTHAAIRTDIAGHTPNPTTIPAPPKKNRKTMGHREAKEWKRRVLEMQKIADAEAVVGKEEQEGWATESLRQLFKIYFGMVKRRPDAPGLTIVLQGLAQRAHLISQEDYFSDLLRSLKSITDAKSLPIPAALHTLLTIARIQALQEQTLKQLPIDIKFVYSLLFGLLGRMKADGAAWTSENCQLLGEAVKALLGPKLGLTTTRIASYAQRLADAALCLLRAGSTQPAIEALSLLHAYLADHPTVRRSLLDRECFGQGAYLPGASDPDMANPFARSICVPLDQAALEGPLPIQSLVARIYAIDTKQH